MSFPNSIDWRSVLHDIFTEITCLEAFWLEQCVTDVYDYGVDEENYFIVMRRYAESLKTWRSKQEKSLNENLSLYLSIYKSILKAMTTIHSHNVTHYDIKCDNILLDFDSSSPDGTGIVITVGDFGECKMYTSEKDEFDEKNRGTEVIMSPEMLMLAINTRKDTA